MKKYSLSILFSWVILCLVILPCHAQTNLVPNPSFEDISDCNIGYGEIYKAEPWEITGSTNSSPDLFHICADENSFFGIPPDLPPYAGDGMAGIVSILSPAEEKIYARLLAPLPTDHDIYLSFAIQPRENTNPEFGLVCYSNTHSMAFTDNVSDIPALALSTQTLLDEINTWTKVEGCYRASGAERYIFLGNYQNVLDKIISCENIDENNFTYSFLDEVIVAAFDVVPDTVIICAGAEHEFSIDFFNLPIAWADGFIGGSRTLTESGIYTVQAETTDCMLQDQTVVIKIPEQEEIIETTICDEAIATLNTPVPALWEDGTVSSSIEVTRPGTYAAELLIDCEEESVGYVFEVKEINCGIEAFVPDIFSPNSDGINDELKFYFNAIFDFSGELVIFDRWGNHLFQMEYNNASPTPTWDGTAKGELLNSGVYIWIFRYQSTGDLKTRILSGDVTIVK